MTDNPRPVLSDAILDKAMALFWQKGYFNTSINELIHVTHSNRAALYKSFGGKHGLFINMLHRYKAQYTQPVFAVLQSNQAGIPAIQHFFEQLTTAKTIETFQHGCFLINTAADLPSHHEVIGDFIHTYMQELKNLFYHNVKSDPLYASASHEQLTIVADFLLANVFGLFNMLRANALPQQIANQVIFVIESLKYPPKLLGETHE